MNRTLSSSILVAALMCSTSALAEWKPSQPIEFVVAAGAGGGTDRFARTVQTIIQKYNLTETPVVVVNKPAGGGSETFVYITDAKNPHQLAFMTETAWYMPHITEVGYEFSDISPVAIMATDERLLWVNAAAPYQSAGDFIAAAKAAPDTIKVGGTQPKGGDQILTKRIEIASDVAFRWVPFKSGGEVAVQLMGGHLDANMNNPSENEGHWKAGTLRPLCVFSAERLALGAEITETQGWSDVPTCKESGVEVVSKLYRTIFAEKMSADELAFYVDLLTQVQSKPEWAEYVANDQMSNVFIAGEELDKLIAEDSEGARAVFEREGWLVK